MIVDHKSDHDNTTDKSTYIEYVHIYCLLCKLIYMIKAYAKGKVYRLKHCLVYGCRNKVFSMVP